MSDGMVLVLLIAGGWIAMTILSRHGGSSGGMRMGCHNGPSSHSDHRSGRGSVGSVASSLGRLSGRQTIEDVGANSAVPVIGHACR
jgi:hypothetical protein